MRIVVVGGGSWGTAFSTLLRDRGHSVVLVCRDPEQVAAINGTGHNPRYARQADLAGIEARSLAEAPF
jgi:glycerol-3-phosphate dehydrogenase (NAD(P)+)